MPRRCATDGPYVSASASSVLTPERASSSATVTATDVRPGAPVGPHTATTVPAPGSSSTAGGVARLRLPVPRRPRAPGSGTSPWRARRRVPAPAPAPGTPRSASRTASASDSTTADEPDPAVLQACDRGAVQAVQPRRYHGDRGGPDGRGGEQVGEVQAPSGQRHRGCRSVQSRQQRRLVRPACHREQHRHPCRRSPRDHTHQVHVTGAHGRDEVGHGAVRDVQHDRHVGARDRAARPLRRLTSSDRARRRQHPAGRRTPRRPSRTRRRRRHGPARAAGGRTAPAPTAGAPAAAARRRRRPRRGAARRPPPPAAASARPRGPRRRR